MEEDDRVAHERRVIYLRQVTTGRSQLAQLAVVRAELGQRLQSLRLTHLKVAYSTSQGSNGIDTAQLSLAIEHLEAAMAALAQAVGT